MRKKRLLTQEHKDKISKTLKGRKRILSNEWIENIKKAGIKKRGVPLGPMPEEIKEKIRLATTGKSKTITRPNPAWFPKGHKSEISFEKGHIPWNKGKPATPEMKAVLSSLAKGRKHSPEEIEKRRLSLLRRWENHEKPGHRNSHKQRIFSKKIIERDKKCHECNSEKGLHSRHVKGWDEFPELRYDETNMITLCASCHMKLHSIERLEKGISPFRRI